MSRRAGQQVTAGAVPETAAGNLAWTKVTPNSDGLYFVGASLASGDRPDLLEFIAPRGDRIANVFYGFDTDGPLAALPGTWQFFAGRSTFDRRAGEEPFDLVLAPVGPSFIIDFKQDEAMVPIQLPNFPRVIVVLHLVSGTNVTIPADRRAVTFMRLRWDNVGAND